MADDGAEGTTDRDPVDTDGVPAASQPDRGLGDRLELEELVQWTFLYGDRWLLSALLLAGVFVGTLALIAGDLITPAEAGDITVISSALVGSVSLFVMTVLAIEETVAGESS
ncbi:hypothetical protein [Natronolimnohabitans innermongolicus]|uniref:Uncharacterized protein n=1 Tax=Natronolimnohabitans innermongolicus JCM 12255 TaxID=1227499 RepID=L9XAV0_9EURY|nr:hypothetical protein [Natronolimnohabitans innermongolicus]ELY57748.1 hypothetical protein C493_07659 [Natronolimnohabitans innermongolicus JCM 12255]